MENKKILDVCCGSRMFWFDKNHPSAVFCDARAVKYVLCDGRELIVAPDEIMDFRNLKFPNATFKLIVFDPPHLKSAGKNSWLTKKYGKLDNNWRIDLKRGFDECWRVLVKDGILIFKWSEKDIKLKEVLTLFNKKPLFGHTTNNKNQTVWVCYMKEKIAYGD